MSKVDVVLGLQWGDKGKGPALTFITTFGVKSDMYRNRVFHFFS